MVHTPAVLQLLSLGTVPTVVVAIVMLVGVDVP